MQPVFSRQCRSIFVVDSAIAIYEARGTYESGADAEILGRLDTHTFTSHSTAMPGDVDKPRIMSLLQASLYKQCIALSYPVPLLVCAVRPKFCE